MTNEEHLKELRQEHRQQQQKYIYYIIALSVAAIAFSVNQTMVQSLRMEQIPLGFAVLCWGASIYLGLNYLQNYLIVLSKNSAYFNTLIELEADGKRVKNSKEILIAALEPIIDKNSKIFDMQNFTFY